MKKIKFEDMTPDEKRVAICKDALSQVFIGAYRAKTGTYFELEIRGKKEPDLKKVLEKGSQESCEVCAVGSVFASSVRLNGPVDAVFDISDVTSKGTPAAFRASLMWDTFESHLNKYFPMEMLVDMEDAFEQHAFNYKGNPKVTLGLILSNIIINKGTVFTRCDEETKKKYKELEGKFFKKKS